MFSNPSASYPNATNPTYTLTLTLLSHSHYSHYRYHSTFSNEVYRLRSPFWYKDAILPVYKADDPTANLSGETNVTSTTTTPTPTPKTSHGMSKLEESILSNVLCSEGTHYYDIASQMFVMKSILQQTKQPQSQSQSHSQSQPQLYNLYKLLSSNGIEVIKCPRSGKPAKKMFRLSYVEGSIYLTWAGKFGNQGIDLAEVTSITPGKHVAHHAHHAHHIFPHSLPFFLSFFLSFFVCSSTF